MMLINEYHIFLNNLQRTKEAEKSHERRRHMVIIKRSSQQEDVQNQSDIRDTQTIRHIPNPQST